MPATNSPAAASLELLIDSQLVDIQEASTLSASIKQMIIELDGSSLQALFAEQSVVLERLRHTSSQINTLLNTLGAEQNYNGIMSFIEIETSLSSEQKLSLSKKFEELKQWINQN